MLEDAVGPGDDVLDLLVILDDDRDDGTLGCEGGEAVRTVAARLDERRQYLLAEVEAGDVESRVDRIRRLDIPMVPRPTKPILVSEMEVSNIYSVSRQYQVVFGGTIVRRRY